MPAGLQRPVKVWAYDESRFGLQTIRRRRITACGTKPIGHVQHRFENFYLYDMVAPGWGDVFFLGLPNRVAEAEYRSYVHVFLDEFAQAQPHMLNVVLLDTADCHTTPNLVVPENVI